jgi:hypothetical protein
MPFLGLIEDIPNALNPKDDRAEKIGRHIADLFRKTSLGF